MPKATNSQTVVSKARLIEIYRQALIDGVSLDHLDQKVNKQIDRVKALEDEELKIDKKRKQTWFSQVPLVIRIFSWVVPVGFLVFGLVLVSSALVPILIQLISSTKSMTAANLDSPIPKEQVLDVVPVMVSTGTVAAAEDENPGVKILDVELDFTNLANWFEIPLPELANQQSAQEYQIEIPALKIEKARVAVGGTNLNKGLIQYPGTALPGDIGAPVIFGHSVLRQFYNPSSKNPNRYNSIFSTIMTLKKGDLIYLTYQDVKYTYMVLEKTEVKPADTYILAQRNDAKLLKLVTCTPEGTYLRRGIVTAQLVE